MKASDDDYILGRSEAETRRLILQHQIYGPITRRFLSAAGIRTEMTMPEMGSGAGNVALLLADLVGPRDRVIGVETNAAILDTARRRTDAIGWTNVTFVNANVRELALDSTFDAVVGR